ncbi:hypothetical protein VPH35_078641 [Triticum aestivum]|uniref:Uncharacterized protein n=1 Tax=Aegilops tauschii TaxID=37682 RepID=M8BRF9_AEGTA
MAGDALLSTSNPTLSLPILHLCAFASTEVCWSSVDDGPSHVRGCRANADLRRRMSQCTSPCVSRCQQKPGVQVQFGGWACSSIAGMGDNCDAWVYEVVM